MKRSNRHKKVPGYVRIGSRYVSRGLLTAAGTAVPVLCLLYAAALHPAVMSLWYSRQILPSFRIDSPYLAAYTGQARLMGPNGTLVYAGTVEGAVVRGEGKLYEEGELVYEGGFEDNLFHGIGTIYFKENGTCCRYTGEFSAGRQNGAGKLYRGGGLIYEGGFAGGLYEGEGRLYDKGALVYHGKFSAGKYAGQGKLYGESGLIYEGEFAEGLYEGAGRLYRNGALLYDGGFAAGRYNGSGSEYNPATGFPVFTGKYLNGVRMEAGIEYDGKGNPVITAEPRPNPLALLGSSYAETLAALTGGIAAYREQTVDGRLLAVDDANGLIYAFSSDKTGAPGLLDAVYLCGLSAADGLVVGSDIGGTGAPGKPAGSLCAAELFALGLSDVCWGRETRADMLKTRVFKKLFRITAYYIPAGTPEEPVPGGRIAFLRVDANK